MKPKFSANPVLDFLYRDDKTTPKWGRRHSFSSEFILEVVKHLMEHLHAS